MNSRGQLPSSAYQAIQQAQRNGHRMILATGRQRSQIYSWLTEKIAFDGIIASSGAYIEDGAGKILFESRPSQKKLQFAVDFFRSHSTPYCLQTARALVTESWCIQPIVDLFSSYGYSDEVLDSVFKDTVITDTPEDCREAEKLAYYNSPMDMEEVQKGLGDYFYVMGYSLSNGTAADHFGEITFEGINKATGIQTYMKAQGTVGNTTVAIGDSGNDIDMIRYADIGVAMGNASQEIKEAADMMTAGINEDGIERAFRQLGLI